jgi:Flp pilus assembly protein TadG
VKLKSICIQLIAALALAIGFTSAHAVQFTYDVSYDDILKGNYNLTQALKCMLVTSSYTPNRATHTRRNQVTNEVTGTGYTAGGQTCTVAVTLDTTNHRSVLTVTVPPWTSSTITAYAVVIYRDRGGASSADELFFYGDFGGSNVSSSASTFQVTFSTPIYITHGS